MKSNQLWCVSYSHERGVQQHIYFGPWSLGKGQKVKYYYISITKSVSKTFIPIFVCVLTNKTSNVIFFLSPVLCPRGGLGVKNLFFPNMVMWYIKFKGWWEEQNTSNLGNQGSYCSRHGIYTKYMESYCSHHGIQLTCTKYKDSITVTMISILPVQSTSGNLWQSSWEQGKLLHAPWYLAYLYKVQGNLCKSSW